MISETDRKKFAPLFTTPIEEFIQNAFANGTFERRYNSPKQSGKKDPGPKTIEAFDVDMDLINRIAPEAEGLSNEERKTLGELLQENERLSKRSEGMVLGTSANPGNPFALDTRGASFAVSNLGASRRNQLRDKKLGEIAPELNRLSTKQREAQEANERREALIDQQGKKTAEREHDEQARKGEAEENKNEQYDHVGLRFLSQGETERAESYLKKAGLSVDEIDEEMHSHQSDEAQTREPGTDKQIPSEEVEASEIENSEQDLTNDQENPNDDNETPLMMRDVDEPALSSPFSLKELGKRFSSWMDEMKQQLTKSEDTQENSKTTGKPTDKEKKDLKANKKLDELFDELRENVRPEIRKDVDGVRMEIQEIKNNQ